MDDGKLSLLLFDFGLLCALAAMVLGPFEIMNWALTAGVAACFFAVASLILAFQYWDELDEEDLRRQIKKTESGKPPVSKGPPRT